MAPQICWDRSGFLGDRIDGSVRIGVGRDAAEAASTTVFGTTTYGPPKVWIETVDSGSEQERATDAISIEAP